MVFYIWKVFPGHLYYDNIKFSFFLFEDKKEKNKIKFNKKQNLIFNTVFFLVVILDKAATTFQKVRNWEKMLVDFEKRHTKYW